MQSDVELKTLTLSHFPHVIKFDDSPAHFDIFFSDFGFHIDVDFTQAEF